TQKFLYIIGGVLFLFYIFLTFILSIWSLLVLNNLIIFYDFFLLLRDIAYIIGLIIIVIITLLIFNNKTNESTGAIDNASGVAILIELAKLLNKDRLENIDIIFLWCGAEERGLWGSRQYCSANFDDLILEYDFNKSYNINIDMVGTYIGLVDKTGLIKKKKMNENLNDILYSIAEKQKIPFKKSIIPIGAGSDHMSFKAFAKKKGKKNFQVCCFLSHKDGKYIHSKKDKSENCSAKNLNGCIEICYNAIKSIDLRAG
ncbi:MAG: M28 family metallopeptidase, partial [Promethearchaeota archaeon]